MSEWPPSNIDLLQKILEDYGCGNSILLGNKHECRTCGKEIDLAYFTGGIIVDRFLSDGNPGQINLFCKACWWHDTDMRWLARRIIEYIRDIRWPRRQAELKQKQEEEEKRKKGVVIYHAEKVFRRWISK